MRRQLHEQAEVTILYLATSERGVVEHVEADGSGVDVVTEAGEVLHFHLMASAHYVTRDRSARLQF